MVEQAVLESNIVEAVTSLLQTREYSVFVEVPNMGQSVDVVGFSNGILTLVEAKVSDWRRAIHQCRAHELVADYLFIAIGSATVSPAFVEEAKTRGYGIIHYNRETHEAQIVLNAEKNRTVWESQRQIFLSNMEAITNE